MILRPRIEVLLSVSEVRDAAEELCPEDQLNLVGFIINEMTDLTIWKTLPDDRRELFASYLKQVAVRFETNPMPDCPACLSGQPDRCTCDELYNHQPRKPDMKTTIPTTPEVRRLNKAVEEADWLLDFHGDRLDAWQLVKVLRGWPSMPHKCRKLADELELAQAEVDGCPGDVPGACLHNWKPTDYHNDEHRFMRCSKCGISEEV